MKSWKVLLHHIAIYSDIGRLQQVTPYYSLILAGYERHHLGQIMHTSDESHTQLSNCIAALKVQH
jgi:hypothetical protein